MYNECRHIMPSGSKCHSPALTGKPFCYYHANLHRSSGTAGRPTAKLPVPQIEDARGIQLTLQQVLSAVESPFIHPRAIGHTLYGLQLAIQLLGRIEAPAPAEVVRTLCNTEGVPIHQPDQNRQDQKDQTAQTHPTDPSDPSDPGPDALAPIKTVCEPPHDCLNCIHQETCDNYQEPDDDPTFEAEEDDEEHTAEESDAEDDDAETEDGDDEDNRDTDEQDDGDPDDEDLEEESEDQDDEIDGEDPQDAEDPEEQQLITAALRILQKESGSRNRKTSHRKPPPDPLAA